MISHLHKLGFLVSRDEVQKYKQSSLVSDDKETTQVIEEAIEIEEVGPSEVNITREFDVTNDNAFAPYYNPYRERNFSTKTIKRLKYTLKSSEFGKLHDIRIHQYLGSSTKGLAALSFKNVKHLSKPLVMPKEVGYDLLWQTSRSLRNDPTPN